MAHNLAARSHLLVLDALGCADLIQLVDRRFLQTFDLVLPHQYGVVTRDVSAAVQRLRNLGTSEFVHARIRLPAWTERGIALPQVTIETALGYSNHQQIELLGGGEGTTFYADEIPADGKLALHHVCINHRGIDDLERRLNQAGFPTVISGDIGRPSTFSTRFRYFDTRRALGVYLEVCDIQLFRRSVQLGEWPIRISARLQNLGARSWAMVADR